MLPEAGFSALRGPTSIFGVHSEVCIDSAEIFQPFFLCEPPEQVRLFIFLFSTSIAIGLLLHHGAAARYYNWFTQADIPQKEVRGMAYNACKAYGIFPIPHLSVPVWQLAGYTLLATVLLATHSGLAPRFFLFASIPLYFLYFGQLFCESKHGGHGSLLMPSIFLFLALSGGPKSTPWSLVFIKIFLGMIYFAGGLSKVMVAGVFRHRWAGSTMQGYVYDGMWSRPSRKTIVRAFQRFCLRNWWVCTGMAMTGLVFEFGFLPLYLFGGNLGATVAAAVAFGFHIGVDILQGLDFKPFWCPIFWAFLPDVQAVLTGVPQPWTEIVTQGYEEEPFRMILCSLYLLIQLVVSLGFFDLWGAECVPFTCCPMFALPRNLFGDEVRGGLMTDSDLRGPGYLDMAYNFSPWASSMALDEQGMRQLPGKSLIWMDTVHLHPRLHHLFREEAIGKEMLWCANFDISPALQAKLAEVLQYFAECKEADWADSSKVNLAIALQEEALALFNEEARQSRRADASSGEMLSRGDGSPVHALLSCLGLMPSKK